MILNRMIQKEVKFKKKLSLPDKFLDEYYELKI
jgi:hypothetical protein